MAGAVLHNVATNDKIKFGVPLDEDFLPRPLVELMVYVAQVGVTTTDLFRRPGNPTDIKFITNCLMEGKPVEYTKFNFYTLASVIKKFLLKLPEGIFGKQAELDLLAVLKLDNRLEQYDKIRLVLLSLPAATQQILTLLFGTWFRIVNHSEYNTMSSEAVAKSVAGSLFHTCADNPKKIEGAVQILQILIDDFGVANMFGRKNIKYFADMTRTGIRVCETYRFQNNAKQNLESIANPSLTVSSAEVVASQPPPPYSQSIESSHKKLTNVSSISAPEVNKTQGLSPSSAPPESSFRSANSLTRFDNVRRRQLMRMKKRSNWFLSNTDVTQPAMATTSSITLSSEAIAYTDVSSSFSDLHNSSAEAMVNGYLAPPGAAGNGLQKVPLSMGAHVAAIPKLEPHISHHSSGITEQDVRHFMLPSFAQQQAASAS